MKKRLSLAVVLIFCLTMLFSACGGDNASSVPAPAGEGEASQAETPAPTDESKVVYFIGPQTGGAAWSLAQKGFEEACAELGWEGHYVAPQNNNDSAQMVTLAETALTNGADALLIVFMSQDAFQDVCSRAIEAGVHVASVNTRIGEEYQDFWIGTDPAGMGRSQAETLVELAGGEEVTALYMQTEASVETQNLQFQVFSEYLEDYDNITVYGQDFSTGNAVVASDRISAIRKANPQVNAIVCSDSTGSSMGAASYVEENGLQEELILIGIDNSADILNYVLDGAMDATIAQDFYRMGHDGVTMLRDVMEGKTVEYANDSGTVVIMPDYVEQFAQERNIDLGR